jgi:protocatechuate 3,4-dioxygenase, beta subunit
MTIGRRGFLGTFAIMPLVAACNRPSPANAQNHQDSKTPLSNLYQCEGCEGALERDPVALDWQTQISTPTEAGEAFVFEGVVYQADGKTPASNVVLYAYHTNADGLYANGNNESEWSRRHGRLRGWVKTGANGRYRFQSIKPAPYPNDILPAHVHITVLEPERQPYWIDDIVFDGEFGVTSKYRKSMVNKGGNGIVKASRSTDGIWKVTRDIVLEVHP